MAAPADLDLKIRNVLRFKRSFNEFVRCLVEPDVQAALDSLELANALLKGHFNTPRGSGGSLDHVLYEHVLSLRAKSFEGVAHSEAAYSCMSSLLPVAVTGNQLVRYSLPEKPNRFLESLVRHCDMFYYQLQAESTDGVLSLLNELNLYLTDRIGRERCILCEEILKLHNQSQGSLPPSVPVVLPPRGNEQQRLVWIHESCLFGMK